jgi:putative phage-type endonuclease
MCQSKEQGGRRCLGYFQNRVNQVTGKIEAVNSEIRQLAALRIGYYERGEEIKQRKRDIRAGFKGRKATEEETQEFADLTAEFEASEIARKANNIILENTKWKEATLIGKQLDYKKDLDEKLGVTVIHDFTERELGSAVFVGEYVHQSPEWYQNRLEGVGGSEISIIMGTSPYTKKEALFRIKTGQVIETPVMSSQMALGQIYEPAIQRRFAEANPQYKVWEAKGQWVSIKDPNQRANIDGLYSSDGGDTPDSILEIKAVSDPQNWVTEPPLYYRQQVLWYMDTFGLKNGKVAVLINQNEYREFNIVARPGEMEEIHAVVDEFMAAVATYKAA